MTLKKKLIEVALPLEEINKDASREKSIRHGHPSTLHLWWARRPLAACRAVLFASMVDDPSTHPDEFPTAEAQEVERQRLFELIEEMVKWENSDNADVMGRVREEILKATGGSPPPAWDPFCGGGSIPLEAQRLGLSSHGSDLNPVAVLITKSLIELPAKFAGNPPINPDARQNKGMTSAWNGAKGLANDVEYYGTWMREEAQRRIGHLYPTVHIPSGYQGYKECDVPVIAWLWSRTVTCPNPGCKATMPLLRSFWLSSKKGKPAWIEPIVDPKSKKIQFHVRTDAGPPPSGTVNRRGAQCLVCKTPVSLDHVRAEGKAGRMGSQLLVIVAEGSNGRVYLSPDEDHEIMAKRANPTWKPENDLPINPRDFKTPNYGMKTFSDLFTPRQLVALTTFSDLVSEVREKVLEDAKKAKMPDDGRGVNTGGTGATAYADTVATYLAFSLDRCADYWNSIATWAASGGFICHCFARQAIPMVWDYAEVNPFSDSSGNFLGAIEWIVKVIEKLPALPLGSAVQQDATRFTNGSIKPLVSTDPPYYDNIGYADLSDFFYVWLRHSLGKIYPDLFGTVLVPKSQELVATPYRFGGDKEKARHFFEKGLGQAFGRIRDVHNSDYPLTVYYAFKQTETEEGEEDAEDGSSHQVASTGWETMLEGLIQAGFMVERTWPIRTERPGRSVSNGTNALASSIVLVCRLRPRDAAVVSMGVFLGALRQELPKALQTLQKENIAPVDLAQSAIGPGMEIFTRYAKVVDAKGEAMTVREALSLINRILDEVLAEQIGDFDAESRWAMAWFEQFGFAEGGFGAAETLSKAKNTSLVSIEKAGIVVSKGGKVRLLKPDELPDPWDPKKESHLTLWGGLHHLIRALNQGEEAAGALLSKLGNTGEAARELAYGLFLLCERKERKQEALSYNAFVRSWPEILRLSQTGKKFVGTIKFHQNEE